MTTVEIVFDTPEKAEQFMAWLQAFGTDDYYGITHISNPAQEVECFEFDFENKRIMTFNCEG